MTRIQTHLYQQGSERISWLYEFVLIYASFSTLNEEKFDAFDIKA